MCQRGRVVLEQEERLGLSPFFSLPLVRDCVIPATRKQTLWKCPFSFPPSRSPSPPSISLCPGQRLYGIRMEEHLIVSQKVRFNCRMESSFPVFLPYVGLLTNPPPEHHHIPSYLWLSPHLSFIFTLSPTLLSPWPDFSSLFSLQHSPFSIFLKTFSQPLVNKHTQIPSPRPNLKGTFWLHHPKQNKPCFIYILSPSLPHSPLVHQAHRLNQMCDILSDKQNVQCWLSGVVFFQE